MKSIRIIIFSVGFYFTGCTHDPITEEKTFPISISEASVAQVPIYIEAIGNILSPQMVKIRPQVSGIIEESYIQQGQKVKKGDPLYKIDPRFYQAALDKAKANLLKDLALLNLAQLTVDRYSSLVKKDYVSKLAFEQFETNVETGKSQILSDQAEVALAELNLEWCIPRSPIEGKISQNNIDPGNLVTAHDENALTDIRQMNPLNVRFSVTQKDFVQIQNALHEGQLKLEVILPQQPTKSREGSLFFFDNHIDPSTSTIVLKGSLPNEDDFFWPGEFVKVRLQIEEIPNAVILPKEALQIGQDGPYVFVYHEADSIVEYRKVIKKDVFENKIIIAHGVQAGEKIVTKGQMNLRSGSKVYLKP